MHLFKIAYHKSPACNVYFPYEDKMEHIYLLARGPKRSSPQIAKTAITARIIPEYMVASSLDKLYWCMSTGVINL